MLKDMTVCLEAIGFVNPLNKVYNLTKDLDFFPLVASLITLNILTQLSYDPFIYSLVRKNKETLIDGPHFIVGLITIFKQYHPNQYKKYLHYMCHFLKNAFHNQAITQPIQKNIPPEAFMVLTFLEELIRFDKTSREVVSQNVGTYIFDYYKI